MGAYQIGQLHGVKRSGCSFKGVFIPKLHHPIELTLDFILRQFLQRRAVGIRWAGVRPHRPPRLRQRGHSTAEEGVEDPQPIEAMLHQLLKPRLDDLQLVLLTRGTPRPAFPPLWHSSGERREWRLYWVPDIEPLAMPPPIGVTGGVRRVGGRRLWLLL